ncbi:hypothetical protein SASPL_156035 [Salvia splendens]|uniref:L-aspartate oxidase n=1 Tax=Salvia splendens TaxID=180675 RepID=A0A8X8YXQ3_SALSN|nr:hypothetical protein SASPL_156035 [Salvia splendens]
MATSVASGSGQLHFQEAFLRGHGGKRAYTVRNIAVPLCMQKELSWCHGISKGLQINKSNYFQPHIKGECNLRRTVIRSYLREGHNKYFDFAVIGSGVAGLRYALEVAKLGTVAVITKAEPHESNTNYAQGGVSAVLSPSDSVESHMHDTIVAGAYLCDEETVRVVCTEGPERIRELIAMGASFDHGEDGNLHLAREGGHSHRRIVHAADMTGREIERALLEAVRKDPNIFVFEHQFAIDLLTSQDGSDTVCLGVDTLNTETHEVVRFISKVTLLASGGAGHIYPNTTNPQVATGDGIAMAHRADAVNMEFVQFHPTALADEGLPAKPKEARQNAFLITEAVRGDGGILYNMDMERFMPMYDERAELAPRDVVARSIDDQLKKRNEKYVLLDISHKPRDKILSHFPNIAAECLKHGLDITRQPIPVVPAAHYMCGGVRAGLQGETMSEVSTAEQLPQDEEVRRELQSIMWKYVGIVRSTTRLQKAEMRIGELELEWETYLFQHGWEPTMVGLEACEMRNLFCCAKLVLSSALARHESRAFTTWSTTPKSRKA